VTAPSADGAQLQAWRFLVSRGIVLGYRVVVAPDFLIATGESDVVFAAAEEGPGIARNGPALRIVRTASGEQLTLVYQRRPAVLSEPDAEPLRDRYGRTFSLIEGYAVKGPYQQVPITTRQWQDLHHVLLAEYQQFLTNETDEPLLIASQEEPFTSTSVVQAQPERSGVRRSGAGARTAAPLWLITLILLAAVTLAVLLIR